MADFQFDNHDFGAIGLRLHHQLELSKPECLRFKLEEKDFVLEEDAKVLENEVAESQATRSRQSTKYNEQNGERRRRHGHVEFVEQVDVDAYAEYRCASAREYGGG